MIKRLENFKEFEKKKKMQDMIILSKKSNAVDTCAAGLDEDTKNLLLQEVEEAEKEKSKIVQEQLKERKELEQLLLEHMPDDRLRTIFVLHYLHGMTLKDISVQLGLSYFYIRELAGNGRKILSQAVKG